VAAEPLAGSPVSEPQVVLAQRVERPVVIRAERGTRLSAKGNDLFEISALGSFDVPEAALRAYKAAAAATNASHPSCDLPWTLLAAIGRVESDHGRYGGSVLGSDGLPRPAIRGVALNGVGPVAAIPDSDNGRFDDDKVWDRAVGPMQFIPTTWAGSGKDGDGDGVANPNDIDDAALAAAGYLCPSSGSIKAPGAMEQAIFSYNHSDYYVALVRAFEQGYRTGTFTIPSPPPPVEDETTEKDPDRESRRERTKEREDEAKKPQSPQREKPSKGKPSKDEPRKPRDDHRHKPDRGTGGSKGDKGGSGGKGDKGGSGPSTPVDKTLTGALSGSGTTWKVGSHAVDFGPGLDATADDWDGDGAPEPLATELEGLAESGQPVTVVLKGGTSLVLTLQGKPW
jgi:hypothetical protein